MMEDDIEKEPFLKRKGSFGARMNDYCRSSSHL